MPTKHPPPPPTRDLTTQQKNNLIKKLYIWFSKLFKNENKSDK